MTSWWLFFVLSMFGILERDKVLLIIPCIYCEKKKVSISTHWSLSSMKTFISKNIMYIKYAEHPRFILSLLQLQGSQWGIFQETDASRGLVGTLHPTLLQVGRDQDRKDKPASLPWWLERVKADWAISISQNPNCIFYWA